MIQFAIYQSYGGPLIADYSHKIQGASVASNNRGFAEASGFIPMSLQDAFRFYDRAGLPHVAFSDGSSGSIYEGRLEDVEITNGGINVRAYGYARAFSDFPYSALWSDTSVAHWRPALIGEIVNAFPDRYNVNTNNQVYIAPQKGGAFGNSPAYVCYMVYQIPDQSSRLITGLSFDYTANGPTGWTFGVTGYGTAFSAGAVLTPTLGPTGAAIAGSQNLAFAGKVALGFFLYYNVAPTTITTNRTPGTNVFVATASTTGLFVGQTVQVGTGTDSENVIVLSITAGVGFFATFQNAHVSGETVTQINVSETGSIFASFTNVRVVTSTANRVNTTLTANRAAGTNVTATVGSTVNMYVGQNVQVSGTNAESVSVLSIGGTTTFNATFVNSYVIGNTVQAHVIYADEIVEDMISNVSTANPAQLSSSIALSQSPSRDLTDQVFVDDDRTRIMDYLVTLGDNQTVPRQWEWGVTSGQLLYFRPQNSASRTWYIDVSEIDVQRTIDTLFNNVYATYQEAGGRRLRGSPVTDATSLTRYAVNRQKALAVQTTSVTQATIQANAALADAKDPKPRSALTVDRIYDANGAWWPLYYVRAGDTMVIRNLPPTLSVAIDRIRIFRLTRAEYHFDDATLTIEPESPLPTLDALLALALPAAHVNNNAQAFLSGRNPDGTYDPKARNW